MARIWLLSLLLSNDYDYVVITDADTNADAVKHVDVVKDANADADVNVAADKGDKQGKVKGKTSSKDKEYLYGVHPEWTASPPKYIFYFRQRHKRHHLFQIECLRFQNLEPERNAVEQKRRKVANK